MIIIDRTVLANILSITAVAYFATSYDALTKTWLFPAAVASVVLPILAGGAHLGGTHESRLFSLSLRITFLAVVPFTVVLAMLSKEFLAFWMGNDFAVNGGRAFQILTIGVGISSFANVPTVVLQARERAGTAGKLHLLELPFYIGIVWLVIPSFGIVGLAAVWALRGAVDTAILIGLASRVLDVTIPRLKRASIPIFTSVALYALAIAAYALPLYVKTLFSSCALIILSVCCWRYVLTSPERVTIIHRLPLRRRDSLDPEAL